MSSYQMGPWSYFLLISSLLLLANILIHSHLNKIPPLDEIADTEYDYVIVGGGSAGCVLASRLSQSPASKVLLLEAGQDDRDNPAFIVPINTRVMDMSPYDWGLTTIPQKHGLSAIKDKKMPLRVAKVLGGSSNVNDMIYARGFPKDYDQWEKNGAKGWSYKHVLPYFIKSEDNENADFVKNGHHQMGGLLKVGRSKTHSLDNFIVRSGKEMGLDTIDINAHSSEGLVEVQSTLRKGVRESATRAFLYPAMKRDNLHVLAEATVTKILFDGTKAVGVDYVRNGRKDTVHIKKEVILSAGTIGSAKLLLLSGIGPKAHLDSLKIPVKADLPVGENLQDCLQVEFPIAINTSISITKERLQSPWESLKHTIVGKGMLSSTGGVEVMAYFKSSSNTDPKWPDLQLRFRNSLHELKDKSSSVLTEQTRKELSGRDKYSDGLQCLSTILRPRSRGSLKLNSADPNNAPLIDPNYLQDSQDVEVLLDGIKKCKQFLSMPSMKQLGALHSDKPSSSCEKHSIDSDDYWRCVIKARAQSMSLPVGTCKIGDVADKSTVVDPQLRVKGIQGLRVADSSIIPFSTSGGTHIPAIMIAEKASDLIAKS